LAKFFYHTLHKGPILSEISFASTSKDHVKFISELQKKENLEA